MATKKAAKKTAKKPSLAERARGKLNELSRGTKKEAQRAVGTQRANHPLGAEARRRRLDRAIDGE